MGRERETNAWNVNEGNEEMSNDKTNVSKRGDGYFNHKERMTSSLKKIEWESERVCKRERIEKDRERERGREVEREGGRGGRGGRGRKREREE